MACTPKFDSGFSFECLREIIADVRSGSVSLSTVQKGLWVLGSAMQNFSPTPGLFGDEPDMSEEELCNSLEAVAFPTEGYGDDPAKAIDPATVILIAQLVWKLIQQLKKK
jgi:hypothetical protein